MVVPLLVLMARQLGILARTHPAAMSSQPQRPLKGHRRPVRQVLHHPAAGVRLGQGFREQGALNPGPCVESCGPDHLHAAAGVRLLPDRG